MCALFAELSVMQVTGCLTSDPATACEAIDFEGERARSLALSASRSVLALVDHQRRILVLRDCAPTPSCVDDEGRPIELELLRFELPAGGGAPEEMVITGSGNWLVYREGDEFVRFALDGPLVDGVQEGAGLAQAVPDSRLIGALRSGDSVLYRDHARDSIFVFHAGEIADEGGRRVRVAAATESVAALGDRNLVMRDFLADGRERLSLLRIAPQRSGEQVGDRVELVVGPRFEQVLFTRDDAAGDPADQYVIASTAPGPQSTVVVFDVASGEEVDRFPGALVPGRDGATIDGLSAVAPDSSRVAYATPAGSLALRDLQANASCRVRSRDQGEHLVAGFAADGTLFFEAGSGDDSAHSQVFAYDPHERELAALTSGSASYRLRAAPAARIDSAAGDPGIAWAVVTDEGRPLAADGRGDPVGLGYRETAFLARNAAAGLWLLEAAGASDDELDLAELPSSGEAITVRLRRLLPVAPAGRPGGAASFDTEDSPPLVLDGEPHPFVATYADHDDLCITTSRASPWSTLCSLTTAQDPKAGVFEGLFMEGDPGEPMDHEPRAER